MCSETCVGRIRYLGVLLYTPTALRKRRAPSAKLTSMNVVRSVPRSTRSLSDRGSPETSIPQNVIEAAQRSPVYKMAMTGNWRYRCTLNIAPCQWSGTSSAVADSVLRRCGRFAEKRSVLPAIESLRIPVQYLANMLVPAIPVRYCGR